MFDWTGKNVVFAGGFSGIGFQMMHQLMQREKLKMMGIVHRMENAEMMKKLQAENPSVKVVFMQMNLMDKMSIEQTMKKMGQMMGNIDVLINCEDVLLDKDVATTIGVNLTSMIYVTMMAMPYMDKTQMGLGGMVMNMSSVYGLEPAPAFAVYAAAKHGVMGFTRSMADKMIYQKTGVMFMAMCPGLTNTEMMMNLRDNVTWHHSEQMVEAIESAKRQMPEEAAMQMIKGMEMMKNGSMWIVDKGQLKEAMPQMHWQM
ncbi:fat body protein 2 [Drosophila sulfurigaster albostrigata]|uniref:Fat body protein 2 n=1 Tax=Drosophila albomicans TaxID=7291 RepID=A0A6P8XPG2_DROAB|nr:fat body protein 2 [Drosophila albomicans]XP_060665151.1 fat body protein 2 [Drosophila nasuta]XP_062135241.1 fat body protein 2 [Drosophila sulfurigaster albostrigata]